MLVDILNIMGIVTYHESIMTTTKTLSVPSGIYSENCQNSESTYALIVAVLKDAWLLPATIIERSFFFLKTPDTL